ncbi:MAG: helix-hairpin-helix domain-containing protein [Aeromicrobium sp.]
MSIDEETRADIARRRLAQLTAAFEGRAVEPVDPPAAPRRKLETQHVKVLATLLTAAAVFTVWWLLSTRPQATTDAAPLALSTSSPVPTNPPELVIDVEGKVNRPGIVTLPKGSRVFDAITAAGGVKGKVDTSLLNMARKVDDGEQILVGVAPVAGAAPVVGAPGAKVNLNSATIEQLDELPGVGPVTSKSILDWRTKNGHFTKVEDLLDVKGIGQATLDDLRDLVTV